MRLVGVDRSEQSRDHNTAGRRAVGSRRSSSSARSARGRRPGARGRARLARLRHRDRRGPCARGRVGGAAGAGRALLPPRPRRPAASHAAARAVPLLTRHGILRERFADTLTDAVRAALLRMRGYRVEVMQFVESKHTPRNTLLRAVRTGAPRRRRAGRVRRAGRAVGRAAAAGRPARRARPGRMRSLIVLAALLAVPSSSGRRSGSARSAVTSCWPSRTPRSSSPAGWWRRRRALRDDQRLGRQRPGVRGGRRRRDGRRHDAGPTRPRTSRRWRRPDRARCGSATSATTPASARRSR